MTEHDTGRLRLSFGPTTGVFSGFVGLAIVAVVAVLVAWQEHDVLGARIVFGALALGVVVWCYQLRPRVVLESDELELRNAFLDHTMNYAAIDDVVVRTVTRVLVGDKKYVGLGVGHPARRLMRQGNGLGVKEPKVALNGKLLPSVLPDYVHDQILDRVGTARRRGDAPGEVRTEPAVPELALLGLFVLGFLVTLFL